MISRTVNDPSTQAVIQLEACPNVTWHPCGSRFFGDANEASDFDFFAEHSEVAQNYLVTRGFKLRTKAAYLDTNTVAIFEKGKVHAVFAVSVAKRLQAQVRFFGKPKKYRRSVKNWNKVYADLVAAS